jgi:environmental stress-induced protein Ves
VTPLRAIDVPPQPWRNGAGATRELLARPTAADWRVRISVADVERDAPFSAFPGVRRWFAVLKGAGVELAVDGVRHCLRRGDAPFAFDGGAGTHCRLLDGPTQDLNLMLRDDGGMRVASDGVAWSPEGAQAGLFSAVAGRCSGAGFEDIALPAYALLWFDAAPPSLTIVASERPAVLVGWWLYAQAR